MDIDVENVPEFVLDVGSGSNIVSNSNNNNIIGAVNELTLQRNDSNLLCLWMRGYSIYELADLFGYSNSTIIEKIRANRKLLAEWYKDEIGSIRAERIEGLRQLLKNSYTQYDSVVNPAHKVQLLNVIFKIEEALAKLQGVLESNVKYSGEVNYTHKLYDFDSSKFPQHQPIPIDVEVKEIK